MTAADFQTLVGRRVRMDLGAEGVYVGELLELPVNDWRGRVRITGVLVPAQHLVQGQLARRGHRPGEFVEAKQTTLAPAAEPGHPTYLAALQAEASRRLGSHSGFQTSQAPWVRDALAGALRAAHLAEERRVASGTWRLVPDEANCAA